MIRWLIAHGLIAVVVLGIPILIYDNRDAPVLVTGFAFILTVVALVAIILIRPYWNKSDTAPAPLTYHQRRALNLRQNGGHYTTAEWQALCDHYQGRCLCCGKKRKLTADHIISVEQGGSSDISNIQPLCKPCNSKKGTRTIDYRVTAKRL